MNIGDVTCRAGNGQRQDWLPESYIVGLGLNQQQPLRATSHPLAITVCKGKIGVINSWPGLPALFARTQAAVWDRKMDLCLQVH